MTTTVGKQPKARTQVIASPTHWHQLCVTVFVRNVGRLRKLRGNTAEVEEVTNEVCGGVPVEGDLFGYSRSRVGTKKPTPGAARQNNPNHLEETPDAAMSDAWDDHVLCVVVLSLLLPRLA